MPSATLQEGDRPSAPPSDIRARLDAIVTHLRTHVPALAPYFDIDAPLSRYAADLPTRETSMAHEARQSLFATAVRQASRAAFGPGDPLADIDARDVRALNIVDHHQLFNHPLLLGTNVIANAPALTAPDKQRTVVSTSSACVSPSNQVMDGGFSFRGTSIAYFSKREGRDVLFCAGLRRFDFVERLHETGRLKPFSKADQDFLGDFQEFLNGLDYSHCTRHKDQITVALHAMWPLLFDTRIRPLIPDLVSVCGEDLGRSWLLALLDEDHDGYVVDALLDPALRADVLDAFEGIVTAWDTPAGRGTHFFWLRHPDRPRLLRMYVEGGRLVPADHNFAHMAVPLERSAIAAKLRRDEIVPSVWLIVSLYLHAGVKPLVGPRSLIYATAFKQCWRDVLDRHGLEAEANLLATVDTGGLVGAVPVFFGRDDGTVRALYGADVISAGGVDAPYLERILSTPFNDALSVSAGALKALSSMFIPAEQQLTIDVGFDEAAAVVHPWL